MGLYEDGNGDDFSWGDERRISYPKGLRLYVDTDEYETVGAAIEEVYPGQYSVRRWVLVRPVVSNGHRLHARLIAEEGIKGLKQRAERARLHQEK